MDLPALRQIFWAVFAVLNLRQVASLNYTLYPREFADITCSLSPNEEGVCVYAYLCYNGVINTDGTGLVDLRFGDVCEDYFLRCCSKATPCADNLGKCVPKDKCGINKNLPKYKAFKESQDCEWSGFTCCPTATEPIKPTKPEKLVTTMKPRPANPDEPEKCDNNKGVCVPESGCQNIHGVGMFQERSSQCSSFDHMCCPMEALKPAGPEKCDGGKGVCLSRNQCGANPDGVGMLEERSLTQCSSEDQICCPKEYAKASECEQTGGECVPAGKCSSVLKFDVRTAESFCPTEGHVCCTSTAGNEKEGQACFNEGICTTRENCNGTVTKDRRNECNGLVCCNPLTSWTTTTESIVPSADGKPCSNGGTCTSREKCSGTVYKDRKNECNGLVCCAQLPVTRTTLKPTRTTTESPLGMPCSNGRGQCYSNCDGTILDDVSGVCRTISCCAPPTEETCADFGGRCLPSSRCSKHHEGVFEECEQLVCCTEERKEEPTEYTSRGCGYHNDQGVYFKLTNDADGESQYGEFPWVVAIFSEQLDSEPNFICGGSLIDPEVILTTADCVKSFRLKPEKLTIRAGEWDMRSSYEPIPHHERGVRLVKTHPSFKQSSLVNNVALLFLDDKFDLTNTIDTVCLPPQNFVIYNGYVTATGWGSTPSNHTKAQQILKRLELPFNQRMDCERTLRRVMRRPSFKLDESFFCAGGFPDEDTCRGDSGSPVVFPVPDDFNKRMYAVGMVSWGVGCGKPGVPAAYTEVGKFRDWIDAEIRKEGLQMYYYDYTRNEDED